jgi:hypothetical protein
LWLAEWHTRLLHDPVNRKAAPDYLVIVGVSIIAAAHILIPGYQLFWHADRLWLAEPRSPQGPFGKCLDEFILLGCGTN